MRKKQLRKQFLALRNTLSATQRSDLSLKIYAQFMDLIEGKSKVIHTFLPIEDKQEIDTWPIVRQLWEQGREVVVPVMELESDVLLTNRLTQNSIIVNNKWGVPEPRDSEIIDDQQIDLVIAPLIAFDELGYRVGYGKGYYDRFLSSLPDLPTIVGLSFFPPVPIIEDVTSHDIKMDYCITPEKIFRF